MPGVVVDHLAEQLGIEDSSVVRRYVERKQTAYDHAWEIRDAHGHLRQLRDPDVTDTNLDDDSDL